MARTLPDGRFGEVDGLALASTGVPLTGCNTAMVTRTPRDPDSALRDARQFFAELEMPWCLFAMDDTASAVALAAVRAGMQASIAEPAMFLDARDVVSHAIHPDLDIETVRDAETMRCYRDIAAQGFAGDPAGFGIWANPDLIATPGLFFYLGRVAGEPVATSCVYSLHGISTINMVTTMPEHRRRGYGEAMVWHAIQAGVANGSDAAYLQSSEMGYPLYERMGFRKAFSLQTWIYRPPKG